MPLAHRAEAAGNCLNRAMREMDQIAARSDCEFAETRYLVLLEILACSQCGLPDRNNALCLHYENNQMTRH